MIEIRRGVVYCVGRWTEADDSQLKHDYLDDETGRWLQSRVKDLQVSVSKAFTGSTSPSDYPDLIEWYRDVVGGAAQVWRKKQRDRFLKPDEQQPEALGNLGAVLQSVVNDAARGILFGALKRVEAREHVGAMA